MTGKAIYQRVVIKVGTSTLTDSLGRVDLSYIARLMGRIADARDKGVQIVLVSSGAIAAGLEYLGYGSDRPDDMPTVQAAAAVGQVELTRQYAYCAAARGVKVGQVLLTRGDTGDRSSYLHARDTLVRLLEMDVLPIVNENDTVAVDEIRFGDNDTLAATVATLIGADLVILFSDIEGLYTADPRTDDDAKLLEHVADLTDEMIASAGGAGTPNGSGGMATKVSAARVLMRAGIPMVICEGHRDGALEDILAGNDVGTLFDSTSSQSQASAKKLWIALGDKPRGSVIVDDGASAALRDGGGSLLPVGVKKVQGVFNQGDTINIMNGDGRIIGRGIARLSSDDISACAGMRSSEIEASGLSLAGKHHEVVHRDELIVF